MTKVVNYAGSFAGDKDAAAQIRDHQLRFDLAGGNSAILDFSGVEIATQSFVHALLAAIIREDPAVLERIEFKHCAPDVQSMIEIVVEYSQEEF